MSDDIQISDYDAAWPSLFEAEKRLLENTLPSDQILAMEHFGSTAIPNLPAKPIIDILIAVPDVATARESFVPALATLDYVFWADNPKTDRLFFVKGMPPYGKRRTHHVHVCERPSEQWDRLLFRDYLRAHPDVAAEYAALKYRLAQEHQQDREAYTDAKGAFVDHVMARATAEKNKT